MPNEPERDIEKLLRACAQKRRDEAGAPLELHPATRRMLHGEVARRTAQAPYPQNFLAMLLGVLRPRLAFGVAILAGLLVATWALLPLANKTGGRVELGHSDMAAPAKLAQTTSQGIAPSPAETKAVGLKVEPSAFTPGLAGEERQGIVAAAPRSAASPEVEADRKTAVFETKLRNEGTEASAFATASIGKAEANPGPVAEMSQSAMRPEDAAAFGSGRYSQAGSLMPPTDEASVANVAPAAPTKQLARVKPPAQTVLAETGVKGVAPPAILASFHITQAGDQIQIIDGDGSTYAGYLHPIAATSRPVPATRDKSRRELFSGVQAPPELGRRRAAVGDAPPPAQTQSYVFKVEGTNRTSNQRVVFSGNLIADAATLSTLQGQAPTNQRGVLRFQQASATSSGLRNPRLTGQAILEGGQTIEIIAAPMAP